MRGALDGHEFTVTNIHWRGLRREPRKRYEPKHEPRWWMRLFNWILQRKPVELVEYRRPEDYEPGECVIDGHLPIDDDIPDVAGSRQKLRLWLDTAWMAPGEDEKTCWVCEGFMTQWEMDIIEPENEEDDPKLGFRLTFKLTGEVHYE